MRRTARWTTAVASAAAVALFASTARAQARTTSIPVRYDADRFIATPVTAKGDTIRLFLDSGGGNNFIWPAAATRLKLRIETIETGEPEMPTARLTRLPALAKGASIPPAKNPFFGDKFLIPAPGTADVGKLGDDGFLGRWWFADRVWVLDYPRRTLAQVTDESVVEPRGPHQIPLTFRLEESGKRETNFPRIRVSIDGDSIDALFDTGATIELTQNAVNAMTDHGPSSRGGSFVEQSVFERWRKRHPDWRVVEHADSIGKAAMPIIEVPAVSIAGYTVGPAWFAMRPDKNYKPYDDWMDKPIHASIGGSVFRYFRIVADYHHSVATFQKN